MNSVHQIMLSVGHVLAERWRQATAEPIRLRPGAGLNLYSSPLGDSLSVQSTGRTFAHPFKPSLPIPGGPQRGLSMTFARGLVDIWEPTVNGKKISTGEPLPIARADANKDGESWACIELTPAADGTTDAKSLPHMVHTSQPLSGDPNVARFPVALILWGNSATPLGVHEIAFFNVRYKRVTKPGVKPAFHLFY